MTTCHGSPGSISYTPISSPVEVGIGVRVAGVAGVDTMEVGGGPGVGVGVFVGVGGRIFLAGEGANLGWVGGTGVEDEVVDSPPAGRPQAPRPETPNPRTTSTSKRYVTYLYLNVNSAGICTREKPWSSSSDLELFCIGISKSLAIERNGTGQCALPITRLPIYLYDELNVEI